MSSAELTQINDLSNGSGLLFGENALVSPNGASLLTAASSPTSVLPVDVEQLNQQADVLLSDSTPFFEATAAGEAQLLSTPAVTRLTITQSYLVRADILALRVETGSVVYGTQIPYEPQEFDEIQTYGSETWVVRDGEDYGYLVGSNQEIVRTMDRYVGDFLDRDVADNRLSYSISSSGDEAFSGRVNPEAVFRKSKPIDMAQSSVFFNDYPFAHTLYLDLESPLSPGIVYDIDFNDDFLPDFSFQFEPDVTLSEAVHVNQVGFRPDDPIKLAYLSTWMGNGGGVDYESGLDFWLVDTKTGDRVYQGVSTLAKSGDETEPTKGSNFSGSDSYQLDFTDFNREGEYRVCVDGVGCSLPFRISMFAWDDAFYTSARGFYYQRSGIALEQPYSDFERPRAFHPDDGMVVYQSTTSLLDVEGNPETGIEDIFTELVAGRTEETLPQAWGGYYDAGDWDRRIYHLESSRSFLELLELFPDHFNWVDLNLPESSNDLPDVLDEALWGLDLFRRLQKPDGGIPGGIESADHPRTGETSWQESLEVFAFAPDVWSSFLYAATAAQAAYALKDRDAALAQEYQDSALLAMGYGERELAAANLLSYATDTNDARNLAALWLFRLTNDTDWHDVFLQTTAFTEAGTPLELFENHSQREAAFLYARLDFADQNQDIKQNAIDATVTEASYSAIFSEYGSFNWTQDNGFVSVVWGGALGAPKVETLLRAHYLTGNQNFLTYGLLGTQVSVGANPDNMTYTTGLGARSPQNPLILNERALGQEPPPGITLYGPNDLSNLSGYWLLEQLSDEIFPNVYDWPTLESFLDVYLFPPATEFTLHDSMVPMSYALGYFSAWSYSGEPQKILNPDNPNDGVERSAFSGGGTLLVFDDEDVADAEGGEGFSEDSFSEDSFSDDSFFEDSFSEDAEFNEDSVFEDSFAERADSNGDDQLSEFGVGEFGLSDDFASEAESDGQGLAIADDSEDSSVSDGATTVNDQGNVETFANGGFTAPDFSDVPDFSDGSNDFEPSNDFETTLTGEDTPEDFTSETFVDEFAADDFATDELAETFTDEAEIVLLSPDTEDSLLPGLADVFVNALVDEDGGLP